MPFEYIFCDLWKRKKASESQPFDLLAACIEACQESALLRSAALDPSNSAFDSFCARIEPTLIQRGDQKLANSLYLTYSVFKILCSTCVRPIICVNCVSFVR